jgi:trigger factor
VTDTAGNPVDLKNLRPDGSVGEPEAESELAAESEVDPEVEVVVETDAGSDVEADVTVETDDKK